MIMQKIQELAITFSGYTFRDGIQASELGKLKLIQSKNIEELADLSTLTVLEEFSNYEKYLLQDKDILIISKGNNNAVNMLSLTQEGQLIIATAAFIIIRVNKDMIDPGFLTWYLQLEETQEILKSYQRTSTVPNLSIKAILDLKVPLLNMEKQRKLGQLHQLHQKRKQLSVNLEKKRSKLIDLQLSNIIANS